MKSLRTTPSCSQSRPDTAPPGTSPAATALSERNLYYYLQQLVDLGYLRRRYPLDRRRPNPKQVRFVMDDPLLRFWFRFVFPNMSVIRSAGPSRAFDDRIAPALDGWFGSCFESLCRGGATPHLRRGRGVGQLRGGRVLGCRRADRRRGHARRQLDRSRRMQVGPLALDTGFGRRNGAEGGGLPPTAAAPAWGAAISSAASPPERRRQTAGTRWTTCMRSTRRGHAAGEQARWPPGYRKETAEASARRFRRRGFCGFSLRPCFPPAFRRGSGRTAPGRPWCPIQVRREAQCTRRRSGQ